MYIDNRPSFLAFEQQRIILLLLYTTHIFSTSAYGRFERTVFRQSILLFPTCVCSLSFACSFGYPQHTALAIYYSQFLTLALMAASAKPSFDSRFHDSPLAVVREASPTRSASRSILLLPCTTHSFNIGAYGRFGQTVSRLSIASGVSYLSSAFCLGYLKWLIQNRDYTWIMQYTSIKITLNLSTNRHGYSGLKNRLPIKLKTHSLPPYIISICRFHFYRLSIFTFFFFFY